MKFHPDQITAPQRFDKHEYRVIQHPGGYRIETRIFGSENDPWTILSPTYAKYRAEEDFALWRFVHTWNPSLLED